MATFPPYITPLGKTWHYAFRFFCGVVLLFLIAPILVIIPFLSMWNLILHIRSQVLASDGTRIF